MIHTNAASIEAVVGNKAEGPEVMPLVGIAQVVDYVTGIKGFLRCRALSALVEVD